MEQIQKTRRIAILLSFLLIFFVAGCTAIESQKIENHRDHTKEFELGVHEFADRIKENPKVVLLDVRQPEEYEEEHIEGSILLPLGQLSQFSLDEIGISKNDEILIYCRSGRRSAQAYEILATYGYTNVKSLGGGLIHWKEDGFSVASGAYTGPLAVDKTSREKRTDGPIAVQGIVEYDFGKINQFGGIVSTTFELQNKGTETLTIGFVSTSCGCTTAEIDKNEIAPGETGVITVIFDPNLHEEPVDRFSRTIFVQTNDPANPELEYRVWVDIIEGE